MSSKNLAWHFLPESRLMRDGTGPVEAGYMYTYHGDIELCRSGLHWSIRALDALNYAPGPVVCRVRYSGATIQDHDKGGSQNRTVLWMADASEVLHLFACDVAKQALDSAGITDQRSRGAISAKRQWLRGEIDERELAAARAAAWAAARDAVRAPAWALARVAERAAAWAAERDAVWAAAWAAARDAVRAAAWAAERDAVWAAAWAAARGVQNKMLEARLFDLEGEP